MNMLKLAGLRTILEEKRLSTNGLVDLYTKIWHAIQYHKFERFTRGWLSYVPTWDREFYEAYAQRLPKKKKGIAPDPLKSVELRGNIVHCGASDINEALDCDWNHRDSFLDKLLQSLERLKGWLATMISYITPLWIE